MKRRYFIDTEFIEGGRRTPLDLISIGIVADDGREYYAINRDFRYHFASDWVKDNVLSCIDGESRYNRIVPEIASEIRAFCNPQTYGPPEFWGDYAAYDWVVLCQLFGDMSQLPKGWPMYCNDFQQLLDDYPKFDALPESKQPHHALDDARALRASYLYVTGVNPTEQSVEDLMAVSADHDDELEEGGSLPT